MAGSFVHVTKSDGSFRGVELLDHLGDAYEALEELHDMVMFFSGGDRDTLFQAWMRGHCQKRYPHGRELKMTAEEWWPSPEDDEGEQP